MTLINIEGIILQFDGQANTTEKDIDQIIKKCNEVLSNANFEFEPLLLRDKDNMKITIIS